MHADEYEDALRYITETQYRCADVFRDGTHSGDWTGVRGGLLQMLRKLEQDISDLPGLKDSSVQEEIKSFGFNRARAALKSTDPSVTETEIAYRVACAIAFVLKATLKQSTTE